MGAVNPSSEQIAAMAADADTPGAIAMLNLIRFRAHAHYPPDHDCAGLGLSGEQAYRRYMAGTAAFIAKLGARVVWSGAPNLVAIGPSDERWDLAFVVEYPSMAAMLKMIGDSEYQKVAAHRTAALEDSRLIRCTPQALG